MRTSSSFWQRASEAGSEVRRLPASISFCRSGQLPNASGSSVRQLSVRINQRSRGGRALAGTCSIRLALKPTIRSSEHWPMLAGSVVNGLSEQNSTFR
ncbi:hypothetical protein D3C85_1073730 [compost metagenome]